MEWIKATASGQHACVELAAVPQGWIKSSRSTGHNECVELADASWVKSSQSGAECCVELSTKEGGIALRDSKDPNGGHLHFTRAEMAAFVEGAKAGEFDWATTSGDRV